MGLRTKFNLVILAAFVFGLGGAGYLQLLILRENAREEVIGNAQIMMAAANAIRHYTTSQITPMIGREREGKFLAASVPSYAAQTNFTSVRSQFPEYYYKEAALNPTNPTDRAADWEADIITAFRSGTAKNEIVSERDTPNGRSLSLARPIQVNDESCLVCHSVPAAAPASMTQEYGTASGFGWRMNEIVGAQIVSLPMSLPLRNADQTFVTFMIVLTAVFLAMTAILNVLLHYVIVAPVRRMAEISTEVSLGNLSVAEFEVKGSDEIAALSAAFNRMRRSIEGAMKLLNDPDKA